MCHEDAIPNIPRLSWFSKFVNDLDALFNIGAEILTQKVREIGGNT